ncbi:DUF2935 domain-containing protein [Shimazuella sp. AN120528]|nr:DUF2935 domain-containing protein [Shimazuella soli]MCH5584242.1 DUF2935 domain-containing protein [Shimazuella soli]
MDKLNEALEYEQHFWLHILRDHCQFILEALAPKEEKEINKAQKLYALFDDLYQHRQYDLPAVYDAVCKLRKFKLQLLKRLLTEQISIHLTPTFLNHMVNELEEYMRILDCFQQNQLPPNLHSLHHHLLWLPDAAGHATALNENTDGVEKEWLEKTIYFTDRFEAFYLKAIELAGYLRTNCKQFPALSRFNQDVELEIKIFQNFLNEIEEMTSNITLLGTIAPLMADHMYREEKYYLNKLAQPSDRKEVQKVKDN